MSDDLEILSGDMPVAVRAPREVGFVKCSECLQNVSLFQDGEKIRLRYHDTKERAPCGMGGKPLSVQLAARRAALGQR